MKPLEFEVGGGGRGGDGAEDFWGERWGICRRQQNIKGNCRKLISPMAVTHDFINNDIDEKITRACLAENECIFHVTRL